MFSDYILYFDYRSRNRKNCFTYFDNTVIIVHLNFLLFIFYYSQDIFFSLIRIFYMKLSLKIQQISFL